MMDRQQRADLDRHITGNYGNDQDLEEDFEPVEAVAVTPGPLAPEESEEFCGAFDAIEEQVYCMAVEKGWWNGPRNDGELIALMHSELSEALEAMRHGNPPSEKIPEFTGVEEELADVIIRIMDYSYSRGLRVSQAVVAKIAFNATRPIRHGGKAF
jgi:NTP pyrophosphatase (non-canonical NTP hydrolase)